MNLTINLAEATGEVLRASAQARGVTVEEYAQQIIETNLEPEWLRRAWREAAEAGVAGMSQEEIDAEISAARRERRAR